MLRSKSDTPTIHCRVNLLQWMGELVRLQGLRVTELTNSEGVESVKLEAGISPELRQTTDQEMDRYLHYLTTALQYYPTVEKSKKTKSND